MSFRGFTGGKDDNTASKITQPPVSLLSSTSTPRSEVYIGKGSTIVGTLTFSGPAEIDCQVEGEIDAPDRVVIGESAMIRGKIRGGDITIKGAVQGDIIASKRLCLKKPARVAGNIVAPSLLIEEGVLFEGKCSMGSQVESTQRSTVTLKTGN